VVDSLAFAVTAEDIKLSYIYAVIDSG